MAKPAHILLADDEAHIVLVLSRRLEAEGYRVTICANGREALDAAERLRPDLIVTDLQMPQMSGLELALALRASPDTAEIPLIMLSGRGYTVDSEALARTNVRELRSKPFSARAIVALVGEILHSRQGSASCAQRAA